MRTAAVAFILSIVCASILTRRSCGVSPIASARSITPGRRARSTAVPSRAWVESRSSSRSTSRSWAVAFSFEVGRKFVAERNYVAGLFVGGLAIALLGVYDDLKGAGAGRKFLVQFAVAGFILLHRRHDREPVRHGAAPRLGQSAVHAVFGSWASSTPSTSSMASTASRAASRSWPCSRPSSSRCSGLTRS